MSYSKKHFLDTYNRLGIKNLQRQLDVGIPSSNNYTPNLDFLNSAWEDYLSYGCNSLNGKIIELNEQLSSVGINTPSYNLNKAQTTFFEQIEVQCGCTKDNPTITRTALSAPIVKVIKKVEFNSDSLPETGGKKIIDVIGDNESVFSIFVTNSSGEFYDFETHGFTSTQKILKNAVITGGRKDITVNFPSVITTDIVNGDFSGGATAITMDTAVATKMKVGDRVTGNAVLNAGSFTVASLDSTNVFSLSAAAAIDDNTPLNFSGNESYEVTVVANAEHNTVHANYSEVRHADNSIDINNSTGSNSANITKKIFQYKNNVVNIKAITPNSLTTFTSFTFVDETITINKRGGTVKVPFTITWTANAAKAVYIKTQPTIEHMSTFVTRTVGAAALPIVGEDVSGSTFYRWPLDNVVGLTNRMRIAPGTNVTAFSIISDYIDETEIKSYSEEQLSRKTTTGPRSQTTPLRGPISSSSLLKTSYANVEVPGVEFTGDPTVVDGVVTSQAGNIVLNKKQVDALKGDAIKIVADGPSLIKALTGYEFKVTTLKAELTKPTTTTVEAISAHATIRVADREGVINNVSKVSGIGIDSSVKNPTLTTGGGLDGEGDWIMDTVQTLENGITLTLENTGRIVTITGEIEFTKIGDNDVDIFFDIEQFLGTA